MQVRQKLKLQPCEEVRLFGAVSKNALRQQEFIITNSLYRQQHHYMLKNFQVIKIKWERCFASHLSCFANSCFKCDFLCASLVGKLFMVRADITTSCILLLWQAGENISLSQVYDYDVKL